MAKTKNKKQKTKSKSTIAKSNDGTTQLTFTIPFKLVGEKREETAKELGNNLEVPGFRKGKAPLKKLLEHIPENTLLERTLAKILPQLFNDAIKEYKIEPVIYPKFELISAKEGEDWQVRATTAEIPDFELGNYEEKIKGALRAKDLWTPGNKKSDKKSTEGTEVTNKRQEKEQAVIDTLVKEINIKIPNVMIDEEVNSRLSKLLERLEKMGLDLDSYLASIGKSAEQLRAEYTVQSKDAIALDLILNKIAQKENIKVSEEELNAALGAGSADEKLKKELETPERKKMVELILKKRKALNKLTSLQ